MRTFKSLLVPVVLLSMACETRQVAHESNSIFEIGSLRPATLIRPLDYVAGTPIPVVILLHGYNSHSHAINRLFGISRRVNIDHFAVILPEGSKNPGGEKFWNATDYCCDFWNTEPDDVAYLNSLYEEAAEYVTPGGAYLIGHSNGGFMAYRMACESMPGLKAIVSLAGTEFNDRSVCDEADPVTILHLHGTSDGTIWYGGGFRSSAAGLFHYPGAAHTVQRWAERAGCDVAAAADLEPIDLVLNLPDDETVPLRYEAGCSDGVVAELWTIEGGPHWPNFDPVEIGGVVLSWLLN